MIDEFLNSLNVTNSNFGDLHEPMIGEDSLEQIKTLPQAVLCGVFLQHLVVLADGGEEHDEQDVFKTMDPLTTFTPLSVNVNL